MTIWSDLRSGKKSGENGMSNLDGLVDGRE